MSEQKPINPLKMWWWDLRHVVSRFLRWHFYWRWARYWRPEVTIRQIMPASETMFAVVATNEDGQWTQQRIEPVRGYALVDLIDWYDVDYSAPPRTRREVVPLLDIGAMLYVIPPYGARVGLNGYEIVTEALTAQEAEASKVG